MNTKQKALPQCKEETTQLSIPEWTQEDFCGRKPYEWLYQHKDNKFNLQILLRMTQEKTKKLKISGFMKTWNAFVEEMAPRPQIIGCNMTLFPHQPIQLLCGTYVADEFGVSYLNSFGAEVEVCSHPIMPVARIIDKDTGDEQIRLAFCRGKSQWKTIDIPKAVAFNAGKAAAELTSRGIAVTSESAKYLVTYLCDVESLNYDDIPEIKVTSKLGWHGNLFVPFDNTLHFNGTNQFINELHEKGKFQTWLDNVKKFRGKEERYLPARMTLAASFASPLLSKLEYLSFWLNVESTISSSGKSIAIMLAASVWGNPHIGKGLPQTANSTTNALEVLAASLNNIPLFIDELQTLQKQKGFAETAYNLCEGSRRNRLNRNSDLKKREFWNLATISSGEQAVASGLDHEGALARVVEVIVKEKIFEDPHEVVEILLSNYGHAGRAFVLALAKEDWQALKQEANNTSKELQNEGVQPKQADSAAVIILADRLAEKYIFRDGITLSKEDVRKYLKLSKDTDMNRRVFEYVCGWCLQYRGNFESNENINPKPYFGKISGDGHYRILKHALREELSRNGIDFDAFVDWCVNHKVIDDKRGKQARHAGCNPEWLLDFHIDALDTSEKEPVYTRLSPEEVPDLPF